jgi:hypothetical protein
MTWGNGFISPLKEGVLRIFNALKNPSPSAGNKSPNLWSNGKHASHYIKDNTAVLLTLNYNK